MSGLPILVALVTLLTAACSAQLPPVVQEARHLTAAPASERVAPVVPPAPAPEPAEPELYSVVVKEVEVQDLLFALARDAALDIDIHPGVTGKVTLNAVDQPLPQVLKRITRQANLRFELDGNHLIVAPDTPYLRSYKVDYVNMARKTTGAVSVATEVATTGMGATVAGGGRQFTNNSTTVLAQESSNQFWETLVANVKGILQTAQEAEAGAILVNRESGMLTVRATQRQHEEIATLIDAILARAQQQVLIEATVVEVELSDRFQAGVDWSMFDAGNGIAFNQQLIGANLMSPPVATLTIDKPGSNNLLATIKMLEQFGDITVLSSPKVMALNNQTAMLKVVDNRIYFTVDVDIQAATATSPAITTFESNVHTVPVGFVMAVTPQIADSELVTLNVRPTISRILDFVRDPNPALAEAGVISQIPEIQVREIESVLKVASGQTAVLGGLMQDTVDKKRNGVPLLSRAPLLGDLFSFRDEQVRKTELVIFLRPTVIRTASVDGDLRPYRHYLPGAHGRPENAN